MVKRKKFRLISLFSVLLSFLFLAGFPVKAGAVGFGPDDGSQLFNLGDVAVSVEIQDMGEVADVASEFGFFYITDPFNLITVFDFMDVSAGGATPQSALIDKSSGLVIDWDESNPAIPYFEIQSLFIDLGVPIGFYFAFDHDGDPLTDPFLSRTVSALNIGGLDLAQTYPAIGDPSTYLLEFGTATGGMLAMELVSGITPVPEPAALSMIALGLLAFGLHRRRCSGNM